MPDSPCRSNLPPARTQPGLTEGTTVLIDEWQIIGDEGPVEGEFFSREEADHALATRYSPDDGLRVEQVDTDDEDDEDDNDPGPSRD